MNSLAFSLGITFDENLTMTRNAQMEYVTVFQHLPIVCTQNTLCQLEVTFLGRYKLISNSPQQLYLSKFYIGNLVTFPSHIWKSYVLHRDFDLKRWNIPVKNDWNAHT